MIPGVETGEVGGGEVMTAEIEEETPCNNVYYSPLLALLAVRVSCSVYVVLPFAFALTTSVIHTTTFFLG